MIIALFQAWLSSPPQGLPILTSMLPCYPGILFPFSLTFSRVLSSNAFHSHQQVVISEFLTIFHKLFSPALESKTHRLERHRGKPQLC